MTDPTVPLSDLAAHLPALAAGRVTGQRPNGRHVVLCARVALSTGEALARCVDPLTGGVADLWLEELSIVCDPHTVSVLARVLAEALGLDARGGAWAGCRSMASGAPALRVDTAEDVRFLDWPADIDPAPENIGLALVAVLRVTAPKESA